MGGGASKTKSTKEQPESNGVRDRQTYANQSLETSPIPVPSPLSRPVVMVDTAHSALSPSRQSQGESPYSRRSDMESPASRPSNMSPRERNESEEMSPNEQEEENLRMHFAQSAMSLGMDNDDLIFNLLYFGDNTTTFQSMFNTAVEETVAAHSAGNTPYKLRPASEEALGTLKVIVMTADTVVDQTECSICQEDLEVGEEIVFLPDCHHSFHNECVQRWLRLQSWCPICRTEIISQPVSTASSSATQPRKGSHGWKSNLSASFEAVDEEMEYSEQKESRENQETDYGDDHSDDDDEMDPPSRSLVSDSSVESLVARRTVQMVMEKSMNRF